MSYNNKFQHKVFYLIAFIVYCNIGNSINITEHTLRQDSSLGPVHDSSFFQHKPVYKLNPKMDIPIVAACSAWSGYALAHLYNKGASTQDQILALDKNSINVLDRGGIHTYNSYLDKVSYYPFYTSIPLPLVFFLTGKKMRNDFWKLTFLYWETMSVMGLAGTSATYFIDRYRPYAYDANTPMSQRVNQNAKNSFYAGHVEIIACSTFFISEVYSSYHPESKAKWVFFTLAGAATTSMAYMRFESGMHFPSDIVLGAATGILSGLLVPYFHNHKIIKNTSVSVIPFRNTTAEGLSMIYRFK